MDFFRGLSLWSLKPLSPERGSSAGHGCTEGHALSEHWRTEPRELYSRRKDKKAFGMIGN